MTIRNLVIGASGLVGSHLINSLTTAGQDCIATYHTYPIPSAFSLDIRNRKDLEMAISKIRPNVIYLPAAFPNVDYCETHPAETYEINVIGVSHVINAANTTGTRLIYFSSDYIFDGKSGPYTETDTANPISEYGCQKLAAEHYISLFAKNYLIVRTTVVYGWERQGKNFVYRLVKALKEGIQVQVPTDQIGTPTQADDLTQNVIKLAKTDFVGVVNVAGPSCINRFEFALIAAKVFDLPQNLIHPALTAELNQGAKRPLIAGLLTKKARAMLQTSFVAPEEGLRKMKNQPISFSSYP